MKEPHLETQQNETTPQQVRVAVREVHFADLAANCCRRVSVFPPQVLPDFRRHQISRQLAQ